MHAVRLWSVRHARFWDGCYRLFERALVALSPLLRRIGHERLEAPAALVERQVKGFLFDCQMCGRCVLSATGMSCPTNCPKSMRNGPCGGVRPDGSCEVKPEMPCVWVQAFEGSRRMAKVERIAELQTPVDHRLAGRSAWLGLLRERERA